MHQSITGTLNNTKIGKERRGMERKGKERKGQNMLVLIIHEMRMVVLGC